MKAKIDVIATALKQGTGFFKSFAPQCLHCEDQQLPKP